MTVGRVAPAVVFCMAFAYYAVLAAKEFTWVFGSGDSGGWLASALTWQPPQPFGNPLYVLLGHALAALPGDLVTTYTIVGSCLASAVTVSLVYLIVRELTKSNFIGLLSSGVLLSSVAFLGQSTTLSQYPLAVLPVVLSFWFYLQDRRVLAVVALGAGVAMHFIVGVIAVIWLLLEWRQGRFRQWARSIPLLLAIGVLPYTLTLWELWRYYGALDYQVLSNFVSNTSGAGGLVIQLFPDRLLRYTAWMLVSFGASVLPIYYGLKDKTVKGYWLLVAPAALVSWYYLTAQDPTVWHYLPWVMPFLAIFAGVGLARLANWKPAVWAVSIWVVALLAVNTVYFNADMESRKHPSAMTFYNNVTALPEGAVIASNHLGPGATARYVIAAERPDIKRVPFDEAPKIAESGADVYVIDVDTLEVIRWNGRWE